MRPFLTLTVLFFVLAAPARAEGPFVGLELGIGDLDINDVTIAPGFDVSVGTSDSTLVLAFSGGYQFASGLFVLVEIDTTDQISFLLADSIELDVIKLGVGYGGPADERFRVNAAAGIAFWELEATESFFFNPGPEATGSLDGDDLYFNLGAEYAFSDNFSMTLTWNYNDYEFGDATATRLGVRWRFGGA